MSMEEEIADICAQLPDIYAILRGDTVQEEALDRILATLRAEADIAAVRAELNELLRAEGIAGHRVRAASPVAGDPAGPDSGGRPQLGGMPVLPGHPVEEFYSCPLRRCTRIHLPESGNVPRCSIGDEPLSRERL
ncbi:hypothetical protein ACPXCP_07270 [Streptomyces sp. DT20]|uniref:hypothetical protein n=1 Tax=unclassified Streptomyces TaxID=2593676 RepID=UPI00352FDAEE